MSKSRRTFSDTVKADAVRRHLSDKVPVSDLADELEVQPSLIHLWVKHYFHGRSHRLATTILLLRCTAENAGVTMTSGPGVGITSAVWRPVGMVIKRRRSMQPLRVSVRAN